MTNAVDRRFFLLVPAVPLAALAIWLLLDSLSETDPDLSLNVAVAAPSEPVAPPLPLPVAPAAADLSRVSLSRQSFRRGGLGSKALISFTIRNANSYAVKNLEIACAFRSRDGGFVTERRRVLADTVAMKSRKAFPPTHVGFVNVRAERAQCALVTASRVS